MSKNLYIISGCNGAGKTTASFTILPEILNCKEFVNADEIAKGLSPFQPEKVAFEAGRIMLHRINELLDTNTIFAFETTLATKSYKSKVALAQKKGYKVILLFFWLQDVELAIERVKTRVTEGGHNIETAVIKRRYINGILNLFNIYLPIADEVMIFDNSFGKPELLAEKMLESEIDIINEIKYDKLKGIYNENI
ncbi:MULTISPECIES: zeta toxin family protein [Flavobacterium]|uniref:Zeta toxin n=1 Tax=Flavobacterium panici TaxID=2654843 RepID=A0A9N8J075_9FLAO|nr:MULTISPECIES: zeta toxin family protein [Flavobacterium]KRB54662.1 zeta toxin [Flavobacterium sp. Root186]CAC9973732.1 zeta toxin [Flavobacterium panici]